MATLSELANWNSRDNRVSREQLREHIERSYRAPFKDVLATMMQCRPDAINIFQWANEHPDRWANAVAVFAKLAGYHEKIEIEEHKHLHVHELSDAELLQRLSEMRAEPQLQIESKVDVQIMNTISDAPTKEGDE